MTPPAMVLLALLAAPAAASAQTAGEVFERTQARRGLIVLAGPGPDLAVALAKAEPVVVLLLVPPGDVDAARRRLAAAGVHGQATAAPLDAAGRLPLADNLAAAVIADAVAEAEVMRVLRPLGRALVGRGGAGKVLVKPRPGDIDDWPQYFHDAAMSDLSKDMQAGPAHGLQWQAGPLHKTKIGVRVVGDTWLGVDAGGLVARDAWSGLPRWRRKDIDIDNRYAFLADAGRIYYYPRIEGWGPPPEHMRVLDLATGEDLLALEEGVPLDTEGWIRGKHDWNSFRKAFPQDWKERTRKAAEKAGTLQARLAEGVLVQVAVDEMVALDAGTGRRLWRAAAPDGRRWHHPLVHEGKVYAVAGEDAPSWSYTHWPMGAVRALCAFDLRSGKPLWRWDWPAEPGEGAAAYNMVVSDRWLAMIVRLAVKAKAGAAVLLVDRAGGREHRFIPESTYGSKKTIGGGHSHLRLLVAGGKLWINGISQFGGADPADPADPKAWLMDYARLPRPVGCTVWRATPRWLLGSLSAYALDGSGVRHTNAQRTACDVGSFPAAGLLHITPNHCFCQPYLPGYGAYHPRAFGGEEEFPRLERGPAGPAPAKGDGGWPMFLADARRGAWNPEALGRPVEPAWTARPAGEPPSGLLAIEWADNWYAHGPATPVSAAEGTAVLALTDRQQVVALDPTTGKERWRAGVDGRVDSSPTIRGGLVYAGTRNGWVYALDRDKGELAWRFFAAPRRERMMAYGQLESPWPLHGSVLVDGDGVWAIAGRHNDADGGLWWWRLDAVTGEPRARGRLGADALRTTTDGAGAIGRPEEERMNGANTPAVSDGRRVLLAGIRIEKKDGGLVPWHGLKAEKEHDHWNVRFPLDVLVPGNQGLLNRSETLHGYKMSYYGFTQAPFFAYRGNDFVTVDGTTTMQHRGGGRSRLATVRRFRKLDAIRQEKHPKQDRTIPVGAEAVWEADWKEADTTGMKPLAVAGDAVIVGFSVDNRDHWRDREKMPFRLRLLDLATGKPRQDDLPLPAPPVQGGISAAGGRLYVVTSDGTVTCFAGSP